MSALVISGGAGRRRRGLDQWKVSFKD